MNFKFEEDFKENLLKLTVSVDPKRYDLEREFYGFKTATKLLENYECPETHVLGECLNPVQAVDNEIPNELAATWCFHLTPKKADNSKATAKKATTRKKKKAHEGSSEQKA